MAAVYPNLFVTSSPKLRNLNSESQGYGALAYYFANKQQIDSEIAADEVQAEKVEKESLDRQQVA